MKPLWGDSSLGREKRNIDFGSLCLIWVIDLQNNTSVILSLRELVWTFTPNVKKSYTR